MNENEMLITARAAVYPAARGYELGFLSSPSKNAEAVSFSEAEVSTLSQKFSGDNYFFYGSAGIDVVSPTCFGIHVKHANPSSFVLTASSHRGAAFYADGLLWLVLGKPAGMMQIFTFTYYTIGWLDRAREVLR